jgi:peptide/nickel transport system ATP-binding protein
MIFQEPMSSLNPVFTVGFQIGEVLTEHMGQSGKAARKRAIELLEEVGIPDPHKRIDAYPFQLSGGQQQRVMIAMAIASEPQLLIADEPTTALDVTVQRTILELMATLQKRRHMAMLFVTHDLGVVARIADTVVVMRDGEVREQGAASRIFAAPRDPYTRALLACRPQLSSRPVRLPVIADFMDGAALSAVESPQRKRGVSPHDETILEARHLAKSFFFREGVFGKREVKAVIDASFRLPRGKTLGLVGESGSGKSTLAMTLMRLHEATGGEVLFEGRNLLAVPAVSSLEIKRRIQIVFQNPYASLNPRFTVGQILLEPLRIHRIGSDDRARRALAFELLEKVGLPATAFFKYPHEFSGGQRQRIAIARCLTMKPDVLICDESVSALDVSIQAQLLNLLQALQDEYRMSYLFISHDLAVVKYMADQVMVMSEGRIVEIADSDAIYSNPQHPYTRQLLASMPAAWDSKAAA